MTFGAESFFLPNFLIILLIGVPVGAVLGSFATAIIHRESAGLSWISSGGAPARSQCVQCGRTLSFIDLVPLLSWIFLGGKCRTCRKPIGYFYPAIELISVLLCCSVLSLFGLTWSSVVLIAAVPFLLSLFVIDLRQYILPDRLQIILMVMGLVWRVLHPAQDDMMLEPLFILRDAVIYAGLVWGLGKAISFALKRDSLGFGDVKFFACAGIWLGLPALPFFLILSGVVGVGLGILWKILFKQSVFPFGPALIVAFAALVVITGIPEFHNALKMSVFSAY